MTSEDDSLTILDNEVTEELEDEEFDELQLELHKEEKETKPPLPLSRVMLIFVGITVISAGIAIGLAAILNAALAESINSFADWVTYMLMIFGGLAVFAGGIAGFWGGQRNIPIRLVSPSDASVVGKGMLVCGYSIEDCMDNEIELTIYNAKKESIYEELLPLDKNGIFYIEIEEEFSKKKTVSMVLEAWMVSLKSREWKFIVTEKKLEQMNVYSEGLKIGKLHFFARVYRDFSDKAKAIFDPKRKEKGVIENVKINESRTTNIFFPSKDSDDNVIPFSIERVAKMRQNALYFDIKRSRRLILSLFFFIMALVLFLYPIIFAIIG